MHKDAKHHEGFEHRDVHNVYGMFVVSASVCEWDIYVLMLFPACCCCCCNLYSIIVWDQFCTENVPSFHLSIKQLQKAN